MHPVVFGSVADLGLAVALDIRDGLARARATDTTFRLGFPTGRSCLPVIEKLTTLPEVDWSHLTIVAFDAYCRPSPGTTQFAPVPADAHYSVRGWLDRNFGDVWQRTSRDEFVSNQVWTPDPADPEASEEAALREPMDLLLLASGSSDGHVGFNRPGTHRGQRTHVTELAETTRSDNLRSYPGFASLDDVPRFGVTLGPATLTECAERTILVVAGREKSTALDRVSRVSGYDDQWPASIIHDCPNPRIYTDLDASKGPTCTD